MEFMGISIGILALVATAMLLFGRKGTLKFLAWLVVLAILGIGGTVGFIVWRDNQARSAANTPAANQAASNPSDAYAVGRRNGCPAHLPFWSASTLRCVSELSDQFGAWEIVGQSTDGRGDPIVSINGRRVQIDKEFLSLPPEKQNATIKKIAASIREGASSGE
jgi:hypothetical protein